MNRNKALMDLTPGQQLRLTERQLGAVFCAEIFAFVLDPRTRRAAERVARWHGCTFRFDATTGCAAFVRRGWTSGLCVSLFESAVQRFERLIPARVILARSWQRVQLGKFGSPVGAETAVAHSR